MNNSKKLIFTAMVAAIFTAPSAYAGAVTNWTGTDGFSAEPHLRGTNILHVRLDSNFHTLSNGNALMPGVNFTTSLSDGLDFGIGGGVNFNSIATPLNNLSFGAIYPWLRAAVPLGIDNIKTGVMLGTSIPINTNINTQNINNNNSRNSNEFFPGVTGLVDVYLGQLTGADFPLTMGVNAGYARGISSGTNLVSGNLNFTLPVGGVILYEEQFTNLILGNYANGGIRVGVNIPVGEKFMFDIKPAALWSANPTGATWSFNPSVGASMKF